MTVHRGDGEKYLTFLDAPLVGWMKEEKRKKSSERMLYPGQRIPIDVKFVSAACLVGEANLAAVQFHFLVIYVEEVNYPLKLCQEHAFTVLWGNRIVYPLAFHESIGCT